MDRLRIGIFIKSLTEPTSGGGHSYQEVLIQAIDDYSFDQSLDIQFLEVGNHKSTPLRQKALQLNPFKHFSFKVKLRHRFIKSMLKPMSLFWKPLKQICNRYNLLFDAVYTAALEKEIDSHGIELIYYLEPETNRFKHPFVSTNWDWGHRTMFCFPEVTMDGEGIRREESVRSTLLHSFAVYCESEAGKAELIEYVQLNPERIFVVPIFPGRVAFLCPSAGEQQKHLQKYGLLQKKYFFYPAQFWPHKNHYNLLLAFKRLSDEYPSIKMLFTGSDKGNQKYISRVVKDLQLTERVLMPGFVPVEEVNSFYRHAVALVMPTFLGPTNMPLLEAEALGCPVICSDLRGHREMLKEKARYVSPYSWEDIYRAMVDEIKQPSVIAGDTVNEIFNLSNALCHIEAAFLALKPIRKTFGLT